MKIRNAGINIGSENNILIFSDINISNHIFSGLFFRCYYSDIIFHAFFIEGFTLLCYYLKERSDEKERFNEKINALIEKNVLMKNEADLFFAVTFTLVKYSGRRRA